MARDQLPSWLELADSGVSKAEAARLRGVTPAAATMAAYRHGLQFADGRSSDEVRAAASLRMRQQWQDGVLVPRATTTKTE